MVKGIAQDISAQEVSLHIRSKEKEINSDIGEILTENSSFLCFPRGLNMNPARKGMAEATGTFILMFCVCGIIACTNKSKDEIGLILYSAVAGFTTTVLIFAVGSISGSHLNPAATIALAVVGRFPYKKVPVYVIAQLLGSILGSYAGCMVYNIDPEMMLTEPVQGRPSAAFWVELFANFMLMFLVSSLTSAESEHACYVSGIVMGTSISLAVLITGPISGGSLNPIRALGPAIISWRFSYVWIYVMGPIIGSIFGGIFFHFLKIKPPISCNFSPHILSLPSFTK